MSRLGKIPVALAKGVKIIVSGRSINVEGPKGKLAWTLPEGTTVLVEGEKIKISRASDSKPARASHGLTRATINNMVKGVSDGFTKTLISVGVGYRMALTGSKLAVNAGFSHPVTFDLPKGITGKVEDQTKLILSGVDRAQLGMVADKIRGIRPPEPYKGKGIRYEGETIHLKEGKAAGAKGGAK